VQEIFDVRHGLHLGLRRRILRSVVAPSNPERKLRDHCLQFIFTAPENMVRTLVSSPPLPERLNVDVLAETFQTGIRLTRCARHCLQIVDLSIMQEHYTETPCNAICLRQDD
jgi:hypothetical protein